MANETHGIDIEEMLRDDEDEGTDADAPEEQDADEPEAQADEAEAPEETDGPARDEKGRFAPKEPETTEEQPVGEEPTVPAAEIPVAEPEPPVAQPIPFAFKVSGQELAIEGATYTPNVGLSIPDAKVPDVTRLMQEGAYFRTAWKGQEQAAEQKGYDRALAEAPEIVQNKAIFAELDRLLKPESRDELIQFLENYHVQGVGSSRVDLQACKLEYSIVSPK